MLKFLAAAAAAALLTLSACASTETGSAEQVAMVEASDSDVVCKRVRTTGSRFAEEVCYTQAQLEAQKQREGGFMDRYRRQSNRTAANPTGMTPSN